MPRASQPCSYPWAGTSSDRARCPTASRLSARGYGRAEVAAVFSAAATERRESREARTHSSSSLTPTALLAWIIPLSPFSFFLVIAQVRQQETSIQPSCPHTRYTQGMHRIVLPFQPVPHDEVSLEFRSGEMRLAWQHVRSLQPPVRSRDTHRSDAASLRPSLLHCDNPPRFSVQIALNPASGLRR